MCTLPALNTTDSLLKLAILPQMTDQNIGPRKVEAKVFQGPTLHRTALGEMSNSNFSRHSLRGTKALEMIKKEKVEPQLPPAAHCEESSQPKNISRVSSFSYKK